MHLAGFVWSSELRQPHGKIMLQAGAISTAPSLAQSLLPRRTMCWLSLKMI